MSSCVLSEVPRIFEDTAAAIKVVPEVFEAGLWVFKEGWPQGEIPEILDGMFCVLANLPEHDMIHKCKRFQSSLKSF